MKIIIMLLGSVFLYFIVVVGCRDIFGDKTSPESIVQSPLEGSNIIVTEPVQGRIWSPGDTIQIKWIAPTIHKIDLDLYKKSDFKISIANATSNEGEYFWVIPISLPLSNHYLIKVSNHNNKEVHKFSGRFGVQ